MKVDLREHEPREGPRCPYCHADIAGAAEWPCPSCRTRHHVECAKEHGRCAELGCRGTWRSALDAPSALDATPVRATPVRSWLADKLALVAVAMFFVALPIGWIAMAFGVATFSPQYSVAPLIVTIALYLALILIVGWWFNRETTPR